ncbi:hypothetical protein BT69DRAFT_593683 [Atractiella rhizophila]|nr:hypothetical protein BT69DRAFT_593683 [Atractiella rhizophila]
MAPILYKRQDSSLPGAEFANPTLPPAFADQPTDQVRASLLSAGFSACWVLGILLLVAREFWLSRGRRRRVGWELGSTKEAYFALLLVAVVGIKTVIECVQVFDLVLRLPLYTYRDDIADTSSVLYLLITTGIQAVVQSYLLWIVRSLFVRLLPSSLSRTIKWPRARFPRFIYPRLDPCRRDISDQNSRKTSEWRLVFLFLADLDHLPHHL